ncbi:hypothetical protein KY284_009712 [Solanum tuberosum]|nr:hypothetical protein KY284_009712 [Solanum tuberosum]
MFKAAVAHLRFDQNGVELFSGKIGIFPFVVKEAAKRNSKQRAVETLETKPILSVAKDITRAWLIEKVLPSHSISSISKDSFCHALSYPRDADTGPRTTSDPKLTLLA